jgi:hypothetical protein
VGGRGRAIRRDQRGRAGRSRGVSSHLRGRNSSFRTCFQGIDCPELASLPANRRRSSDRCASDSRKASGRRFASSAMPSRMSSTSGTRSSSGRSRWSNAGRVMTRTWKGSRRRENWSGAPRYNGSRHQRPCSVVRCMALSYDSVVVPSCKVRPAVTQSTPGGFLRETRALPEFEGSPRCRTRRTRPRLLRPRGAKVQRERRQDRNFNRRMVPVADMAAL